MAEYPWEVKMTHWGVPDIVQRVDYNSGFTINGDYHRYIAKQIDLKLACLIVELHNNSIATMRKGVEFCCADLRHAYSHLVNDRVNDQKELADGLISSIIRRLEKLVQEPLQ